MIFSFMPSYSLYLVLAFHQFYNKKNPHHSAHNMSLSIQGLTAEHCHISGQMIMATYSAVNKKMNELNEFSPFGEVLLLFETQRLNCFTQYIGLYIISLITWNFSCLFDLSFSSILSSVCAMRLRNELAWCVEPNGPSCPLF